MNITEPEKIKKAALFHDMSCFGRCALSVIIPIISVLKVQPVIIPTALLSTHTGGFSGFTFHDLTEEIKKITDHFDELDLIPDCVYTGFLGSEEQINIISDYIKKQKSNGAYIFVDPVMADDGKLYSSYNNQLKKGMSNLAMSADIITPNITEAMFLLDMEYKEPPYSEDFIDGIILKLFELCEYNIEKIVITSVVLDNSEYGVAYGEKIPRRLRTAPPFAKGGLSEQIKTGYIFTHRHEKNYPGSGDIFSSILCGKILNGAELEESVISAVDFLDKVIEYTINAKTPEREGLIFENFLHTLS